MCIIIDANIAHTICSNPPNRDGDPIRDCVEARKLKIASGGKNAEELHGTRLARWFLEQWRAGFVRIYPPNLLNAEERNVTANNQLISNDSHVIALARVSGARLLYTHDRALQEDFKNRQLLRNPKGRVYTSRRNLGLLTSANTCR
jgi:hypothetical protein